MDMKIDETGQAVVPILSCVLNQLCKRNDKIPLDPNCISKFHAMRPPQISILNYLERIAKYAACSGECFVLALIFVDRIIQFNPTFVVNSLNIHRLLITAVMLSAKYFDDQYFNNAYYAKVGGVPCNEINSLEVEFLFMINFTLFVSTDTYTQYFTELSNHAAHASSCGCTGIKVPGLRLDHLAPLVNVPFHKVLSKSQVQQRPPSQKSNFTFTSAHGVSTSSQFISGAQRDSTMLVEDESQSQGPHGQPRSNVSHLSNAMVTEASSTPQHAPTGTQSKMPRIHVT